MGSRSSPWATLRSAIVIAGLGFAAASIGVACLDHVGEDFGACDAGTASAATLEAGVGSGSGLAALQPTEEADCGAATPAPTPTIGSGSGSAAP